MRKAAKQIAVCAVALAFLCVLFRFAFSNRLNVYIPMRDGSETDAGMITIENPEVLRTGDIIIRDRYMRVTVYPGEAGESDLRLNIEDGALYPLRVSRFHAVYDLSSGNFSGDTAVLMAVALFWLLTSAIMFWHYSRARGSAFYDYGTIYYAGFSLFALASGLVVLSVTISHILHPETYSMSMAYLSISGASARYMQITTPLMLLFAASMAVSNIALLRHERHHIWNSLGLLVSILLVLGEAVGWYLFTMDFSGSEREGQIFHTVQNVYATVFVYCQCMLTGSVICGIRAARYEPETDKDFIIILGCWFRKDGTLPPLLRGRADKALEFWHRQKAENGKEACFIPCGGQGRDEPMPEAEAIRQYLISKGVEERLILAEDQSYNTYQNMANARQIIRETNPEGNVLFATTNYHVFRSGLWARRAGLSAEGIGSRTKWWFWPNAFIRETAGLLHKRWKQELLFLILMTGFFGFLSVILW